MADAAGDCFAFLGHW